MSTAASSGSSGGSTTEEYEKAILWVPDPNSPAGWIRRKVWGQPAEDESKKRTARRPMGFAAYLPAPRRAPAEEAETD